MEKERYLKYVKICERAERMKIDTGDRMGALMDIESADKKFNMRLDDWLQAYDFNFAHDYCGIQNNIKRGEFPAILDRSVSSCHELVFADVAIISLVEICENLRESRKNEN